MKILFLFCGLPILTALSALTYVKVNRESSICFSSMQLLNMMSYGVCYLSSMVITKNWDIKNQLSQLNFNSATMYVIFVATLSALWFYLITRYPQYIPRLYVCESTYIIFVVIGLFLMGNSTINFQFIIGTIITTIGIIIVNTCK